MNIQIKPELEKIIQAQIATGRYARVSASQTLLTNGFYESVELGKAAAKTETIY